MSILDEAAVDALNTNSPNDRIRVELFDPNQKLILVKPLSSDELLEHNVDKSINW